MTPMSDTTIRVRERRTLSDNHYRLESVRFDQTGRDGATQTLDREIYHNATGAAVLPIDAARDTVLLVRQFRLPAYLLSGDTALIEACAGVIDNDDDPADTVRREAEEELGYRIRNVTSQFALYTSPGACTETLHLFLADYTPADRIGAGGGLAGEGERIEILECPLDVAWAMVASGEIRDAKTVLLLQQARLQRLAAT